MLREPLSLDIAYPIQWHESIVDLTELAKLRYLEGWSREQLARHYGRTLNEFMRALMREVFDNPVNRLFIENKAVSKLQINSLGVNGEHSVEPPVSKKIIATDKNSRGYQ